MFVTPPALLSTGGIPVLISAEPGAPVGWIIVAGILAAAALATGVALQRWWQPARRSQHKHLLLLRTAAPAARYTNE